MRGDWEAREMRGRPACAKMSQSVRLAAILIASTLASTAILAAKAQQRQQQQAPSSANQQRIATNLRATAARRAEQDLQPPAQASSQIKTNDYGGQSSGSPQRSHVQRAADGEPSRQMIAGQLPAEMDLTPSGGGGGAGANDDDEPDEEASEAGGGASLATLADSSASGAGASDDDDETTGDESGPSSWTPDDTGQPVGAEADDERRAATIASRPPGDSGSPQQRPPAGQSDESLHSRPSRESPTNQRNPMTAQPVAPTTRRPPAANETYFAPSAPTTTTTSKPQQLFQASTLASFHVDMGADRMMIKPAHELGRAQQRQSQPTDRHRESWTQPGHEQPAAAPSRPTTFAGSATNGNHELATESVNHQQLAPLEAEQQAFESLQHQHQQADELAAVCLAPGSLVLIILITMLVSVALTYCAQQLARHLKRHQFDLVERGKQLGHKRVAPSGSNAQSGQLSAPSIGANSSARLVQYGCSSARMRHDPPAAAKLAELAEPGQRREGAACVLHPYQRQHDCPGCWQQASPGAALHSSAFRNPYFAEQQHQQLQRHKLTGAGASLLVSSELGQQPADSAVAAVAAEQLHFIQNHIATLHDRQVTSSVRELSLLGQAQRNADSTGTTSRSSASLCPVGSLRTPVVDLTSREHRARVLQDPRPGDLLAVDLSGHDIIGLGFDVCGGQRDGIFIKSVLSRGPARESGAIQAGDRIKCLNVGFDNITLQDACDILNCASPYKMRLLIEKRAAGERSLASKASARHQISGAGGGGGLLQEAFGERAAGTSPSPMQTTRSYIKRLAGRLTGVDQPDSSGLLQTVEAAPLGSRAARELQHSRRALRSAGHANEAFSDLEGAPSSAAASPAEADETPPEGRARGRRRKSTSDDSSARASREANRLHKLHGPQPSASKTVAVDLSQLSDDDRDDRDDHNHHHHVDESRESQRRQSADMSAGATQPARGQQASSSSQTQLSEASGAAGHGARQRLNQSQSQPEMGWLVGEHEGQRPALHKRAGGRAE